MYIVIGLKNIKRKIIGNVDAFTSVRCHKFMLLAIEIFT